VAKPQHPHLSLLQGFSEADGSGSGWQWQPEMSDCFRWHWQMSQCLRLSGPSEEACGSLDPEDISRRQLRLPAEFSTGLHRQDHPRILERHCEILNPGISAAICSRSEPLDFSNWSIVQEKVQARSHINLAALR
jgi:hypothetical protein